MNRYLNGYSYIVEITYPSINYKHRYEFVSEHEAQEFIDSLNNHLPKDATIKFI